MLPALFLWLACWPAVVTGCDGSTLLFPEQVTYAVEYVRVGMALAPECAPDEAGQPQPCAVALEWGEFPTGAATCLSSDSIPVPPVGQVYDVQEPVAMNAAGRCEP